MKLINHMVEIKVEDGNYVYINTLNGAVDIFNEETHQLIQALKGSKLTIDSEYSKKVVDFLNKRGYIVKDEEEEKNIFFQLIQRLKNNVDNSNKCGKFIRLVLTYDCNFRCPYCYEDHVQTNGQEWVEKVMTKEMVDIIASQYCSNVEWVSLFGGEPLLLKNMDLVSYIMQKISSTGDNVAFGITTNGYTLEEYIPLLKKYNVQLVEVTIDGLEDVHNSRRFLDNGKGTYTKILKGVELALKNELPIQIRMNIDDFNYDSCDNLSRELVERFANYSNLKILRNATFGSNKSCRSEIFEKIFESEMDDKKLTKLSSSLEDIHSIGKVFQGTGQWSPKYIFCDANKDQRLFDPHGDIYTCWLALGKKELRLGKYYPGEDLDGELPWLERTVETMTPCKDCNIALLCGGGCSIASHNKFGDIMKGYCQQKDLLLNKIVPLLYKKYIMDKVNM